MNKGLTDELKAAFPGTTPNNKPNIETYFNINPLWFVGFTSGEGCFSVIINKSQSTDILNNTRLSCTIRSPLWLFLFWIWYF